MTTLPRFDSINLGDSSVPADAQEQFARLAAAAGEQEPWTTPEQIPVGHLYSCLLYTSPSPRDVEESRMPSSA